MNTLGAFNCHSIAAATWQMVWSFAIYQTTFC